MGALLFIIILFVFFVGGGWLIGKSVGNALFPDDRSERNVYIDKSVHHHYHEHKSINVIDDVTKKRIFQLKESKDGK